MVTMPRIDGHVFTETPFTSFTSGSYRDVPFMTGIVSDEWSINMGWMIENLKSHSSKRIGMYQQIIKYHMFAYVSP